jgi:ribA/ribD-fused uncharacterized protein
MITIGNFQGGHQFLSNFYVTYLMHRNIQWRSNEHFYQGMKAVRLKDFLAIHRCQHPGEAKRIGNEIKVRKDWEDIKVKVMWAGLWAKFENPNLRHMLLATKDAKLIEGNWWGDAFWGVDLKTGKGKNKLGKLLMQLRDKLKED